MRCPNCGSLDTQVKDSRPTEDSSVIRRRRVCLTCNFRFTTFERVQLRELVVIKRNGRRVPFDRDKLLRSVQIALRKRPVEPERIDQVVSKIVRELESQGESEVSSETVGEMVMETLRSTMSPMCALPRCIAISAKPRISRPCSTNCRARRTRRRRRGSERIGLENFRRSI
jgi:transcriptional repressor NrdR